MNTDLTYRREGDYLLPNVVLPKDPQIGILGLRRRNYLLNSKKPLYTGMLLSGKLSAHLEETDRNACEMFAKLVEDMAKRESVTETLKAENQMEWVCRMNALRSAAEEVVLHDLIYC